MLRMSLFLQTLHRSRTKRTGTHLRCVCLSVFRMKFRTARLLHAKKYVCIEPVPGIDHHLITKNIQAKSKGNSDKVKVYEIDCGNKSCMAFCFEQRKKTMFPVIDGDQVRLENVDTNLTKETLNEKFLFRWGEGPNEDWRSLRSVAQPQMFLCVEKNEVTVKPEPMADFKIEYVSDMHKDTTSRSTYRVEKNLTFCKHEIAMIPAKLSSTRRTSMRLKMMRKN